MNRRKFCKSLAMVPVAAVAVSIGLKGARVVDCGNVKLQFPTLIHKGNQTGRWASGCLPVYFMSRDGFTVYDGSAFHVIT
ncbi:MAG: hypothetical protein V3S12_01250 [Acidiferrobacterales bacterium]